MRLGTKLLLILLSIVVLVVGLYQGWIHIRYRMYDGYKQYLPERGGSFEEGRPFQALQGSGNVPGMVLAAQNADLELYYEASSTNIAVYDKRTGGITYACPPGADDDPLASNLNKAFLKSPIVLEFFTASRTPGSYNCYNFSVTDGQYTAESLQNGLRITYTIGDLTLTTGIVPVYIHEDRLKTFLDRMDEKQRNDVSMRYMPSDDAPEGFLELLSGARGAANIRRLTEAFVSAGYTEDDLVQDALASGMEGAIPISFTVPLEYRLDGDALLVTVPTERVEETGGAKIDKIHVLRGFGAGGAGEDGYILVPNGSGSLIRFNNGKVHAEDYRQFIYGLDPLSADYIVLGNAEMARLPVFGLQKEGTGIFAVIEEGQSLAQVTASIAGGAKSYNNVYPVFTVRGSSSLSMFGTTGLEGDMRVIERDLYEVDLTVRYSFLTPEYDGYSGMARYYRERLERDGVLSEREAEGDVPLYMDMIGAVTGIKFVISVPYLGIIPMTTYQQAGEISDRLYEAGVRHQVVNYQGWFNRGYYHDVPDRIQLVRQLGNKSQLEELSSKLEARGGKLYTDIALQEVTFISKRFKYTIETSRFYAGGRVAARAQINPVAYRATTTLGYIETAYDMLSPKFLPRYVDDFQKLIERYGVSGVSLRDLGDALHSDRKNNEFINREQALSIVTAQLEKLAGSDKDVMVSGGNAYALQGTDDLINVPLAHNDFYLVDEEVPFYQMVVHGYIPYAGYAFNRADMLGETDAVLQMLEFGAAPHFTFSYEEASEMKYTGLNRMFSTCYDNWADTAIHMYSTVNAVLRKVSGHCIREHAILDNGLRCVTYDNGVQIIVNRTGGDLEYNGTAVPAKGYAVREGVTA